MMNERDKKELLAEYRAGMVKIYQKKERHLIYRFTRKEHLKKYQALYPVKIRETIVIDGEHLTIYEM